MKKIFALMSAAVLALGFTACSSDAEETIEGGVAKAVKVNISVGEMNNEDGTRAVKTNWENGDKLNIWFDGAYWSVLPQLVLTYNGGNWTASEVDASLLKASGKFNVVYEATNNYFSVVRPQRAVFNEKMVNGAFSYAMPLSCFKNNVIYTYADNCLTANISSFNYATGLQVVVTGLDKAADKYTLSVSGAANIGGYYGGTTISITANTTGNANIGVANADGVAFYFNSRTSTAEEEVTFTLYDIEAGTTKTYTKTGTLTGAINNFKAIKIAASKFE